MKKTIEILSYLSLILLVSFLLFISMNIMSIMQKLICDAARKDVDIGLDVDRLVGGDGYLSGYAKEIKYDKHNAYPDFGNNVGIICVKGKFPLDISKKIYVYKEWSPALDVAFTASNELPSKEAQ